MNKTLKDSDFTQIEHHGLTQVKVEEQIENFKRGFGCLHVESATTVGSGIFVPDAKTAENLAHLYDSYSNSLRIVKFVPASGAATRMFKELFEYAESGEITQGVERLLCDIENFAFFDTIKGNIKADDPKSAAVAILNYGAELPKGLIFFHKYPNGARTAFEEHMVEGAMYARSGEQVNIHFTISEEHRAGFEELLSKITSKFEQMFGCRYSVSFSQQKSSTDTIAVTPENEPFRESDGSLLFRPAGHGALIENLNHIDADIIFIKNIDNVTSDRLKADTVLYKKAIAGMLVSLQEKAFAYLNLLDRGANRAELADMAAFIQHELMCLLPESYSTMEADDKISLLRAILDRPIRVCGMVRNEGEPGGGPFWVKNANGATALQIAEPSQISPEQKYLLKEGTHFNPVDLVCGVMRYNGEKFDLLKYIDPKTGFISEKSKNGRALKAQELPGLWNGAMADWNTIFMEVPVSTFTPVKEVTDLLRPYHQ